MENEQEHKNEMDRYDHLGMLDGIPVRRCLKSGFCCTKAPCGYGEFNEQKTACKYLSEPNEIGQKICNRYEWIKQNVPNWESYPAFGGGCCMPMFNTAREQVLIKLKEKEKKMINYPIEHKVRASIIEYCKSLEGQEISSGNTIAQKISSLVAIGLLTVQQRKIYDCLTDVPKDTVTIAHEAKLPHVQVINQLRSINKMTQLISHVIEGRNKLWTKN